MKTVCSTVLPYINSTILYVTHFLAHKEFSAPKATEVTDVRLGLNLEANFLALALKALRGRSKPMPTPCLWQEIAVQSIFPTVN